MARLTIDASGLILLEIPDAKGETQTYSVNPNLITDLDERYWSVFVRRLDTGAEYLVACGPTNRWTCGCKDFEYRAQGAAYKCKHITNIKCIKAALDRLMPRRQPAVEAQEAAS